MSGLICLHYNKQYFFKEPTMVKKKGNKNYQEVRVICPFYNFYNYILWGQLGPYLYKQN